MLTYIQVHRLHIMLTSLLHNAANRYCGWSRAPKCWRNEDSFVRELFEFVSLVTLGISIVSFCVASDPHYRLECLDVRCQEKKWVDTETFWVETVCSIWFTFEFCVSMIPSRLHVILCNMLHLIFRRICVRSECTPVVICTVFTVHTFNVQGTFSLLPSLPVSLLVRDRSTVRS